MLENIEGLMDQIRDRFAHVDTCPVTGERIFFENAGGALTLKSVVETSGHYAAIPDNQGRDNPTSQHLMDVIAKSKADMLRFLGASSGQPFVGESGTEVLFRLITAACQNAGGSGDLVGSTLEHPASASAGAYWAERSGLNNKRVPHDVETGSVSADAYRELVTPMTKVVTILHTSPVTGIAVDLRSIVEAVRSIAPDCFIIVDGIQHGAHGAVGLGDIDIDGYAISPYKVFSRHGYGVGWVSERLMSLPHNRLIGSPEAQWELGTRDTGAYATFSDMVAYLDWLGGQVTEKTGESDPLKAASIAVSDHETRLCQLAIHGDNESVGLSKIPGVTILGGLENAGREGLVSFAIKDVESPKIVSYLNDNGVRTHTRKADHYSGNILTPMDLPDCVRVSFCHYNTESEVRRLLEVMEGFEAA